SEEGVLPMAFDEDALLHFFCECSNEKCRQRIRISPKAYNKIHKSRDTFIMVHGHEVEGIEDVTIAENGYCVVKKRKNPPKSATRLHPTDINNP
ncbi:MAG: hypothetical protein JWP13_283, partial [Candidatus Saccharibacteria bacterium]|nr:hypothetical protein [Candidatus Saccharibacteria bacterium]